MASVVTCLLRADGRVLLTRRTEAAATHPGRWDGVSGRVADGESPEAAACRAVDRTGLGEAASPVRTGRPLTVLDPDATGGDRRVHPILFDVDAPDGPPEVAPGDSGDHAATEWIHPTTIRRRETVPGLWRAYERVAPSVRSVAADGDHGAAYLSVRALEVLRDRAGLLAVDDREDDGDPADGDGPGRDGDRSDRGGRGTNSDETGHDEAGEDWAELADLARRLRSARPGMVVVRTRLDRAMSTADRTAAGVEAAARRGIDRAVAADRGAAAAAADLVADARVLTLSRSGTVLRALRSGDPRRVYVAESRPGREGVGVAEELSGDVPTVLHTEAAVAEVLATREVDLVLVGADAVAPDGSVHNKAGTRTVATVAARAGVPTYAVAAADKVAPDRSVPSRATAAGTALYDGDRPVEVYNPLFDETPADLVAVVTDRGRLDAEDVAAVADDHRSFADWDRREESDEDRTGDAVDGRGDRRPE